MSRLALVLYVTLLIDYSSLSFAVNVDLGDYKIGPYADKPSAETVVSEHICEYLKTTGHLDWLPVLYTLVTHVPRGEGAWVPDPSRTVTGVVRSCG